ncbi:amidohydrolase family protein [Myxococcota bacterium]|nr:amidohydrolase family protein [Myxococcota bacterium]
MELKIRHDWLNQVQEEAIDPDRPIVDPHHHFFDLVQGFPSYDLEDFKSDFSTHRVEQTVFAQCGEHYREDGPEEMAPVGETEWVDGLARQTQQWPSGTVRVGGIVGTASLSMGSGVREVLEAHVQASDLFRGIRDSACWDADPEPSLHSVPHANGPDLYASAAFREGLSQLAPLGLSFDAYHYHTQTQYFIDLARAFPDTTMILDHLGTPVGVGGYAGKRDEIFEVWKRDHTELASCENVVMKLGGLVMPWNGFGFERAPNPPTSDEIVALQARYYHHAIEAFGPDRCMFESNFPVDKLSVSYGVLWNAFKKIAAQYSEDEKESLFRATAMRVYRLSPVD